MQDDLTGEDRLLAKIAADPSADADVLLILLAAKRDGVEWPRAWKRVMRSLQPPNDAEPALRAVLEHDRRLMQELRPHYQAAYEQRPVTFAERRREDKLVIERAPELAAVA